MNGNFTKEEIDTFVNMGKIMASKAVITAVIDVCNESADLDQNREVENMLKDLMPCKTSGFVQCEFNEQGTRYLLNISLTRVERDYVADISIPHMDYAKDLFIKYGMLRQISSAYWRQFCEDHPEALEQISKHRPDVDWCELKWNEKNPTSAYFIDSSAHRIGILPYYVNPTDGKPWIKRPSDKK